MASAGFLHIDLIRRPSAISTSIVLVDICPQVFFYFVYLIEDKGSPGAGDDGVEERRGHVSPFPPLGGRAIRRRWQEDFTFWSSIPLCHYNIGNMVMKICNALGGQMGLFHNNEKVGESHKKR